MGEIEELDFSSGREFYDTIYLFSENKEYKLELKSRKCNVSVITRPFMPAGIPQEGRYVGESVVGPVTIANGYFSNKTGFVHTSYYDIVSGLADPEVFVP